MELVAEGKAWGEERVLFRGAEGRLCSVPRAWTSLATADPFVVVAAGRALFRPADLLALAALVRDLSAGTVGVKGISPRCKGDDAAGSPCGRSVAGHRLASEGR